MNFSWDAFSSVQKLGSATIPPLFTRFVACPQEVSSSFSAQSLPAGFPPAFREVGTDSSKEPW